ncbi:hypothetical protein IWW37_002277 [Coemansia sp. RSA 2050]|nr:hypothetical protein IWW37_002277 [Coemansia sp. RSA 2050]
MSNTKPDSASFSSPKLSQPPVSSPSSSRHNNGHHGQQGRGKDGAARNPPSHKHTRQSNRGKQNNSNQRSAVTSADDESATDSQATLLSTPTKKPGRAARRQAKLQQAPPKIALLMRTAPEGEQQDLLARFANPQTPAQVPATVGGRSSGKRNRRPQDSPPRCDDGAVVRTPNRRPNKLQFQPNSQQQSQARTASGGPTTIYSPTPRAGHVMASPHGIVPGRGSSPGINRSNHYAGASFNNSPAPATLPLPPSFLISPSSTSSPPPSFQVSAPTYSPSPSAPTSSRNSALFVRDEDVFAMAASTPVSADRILSQQQQQFMSYHTQVNAVLSERSRQLEHMLANGGARPNQHLNANGLSDTLDLAQPATDMASMFQKLRLIKEMSQNRPATVEPVAHHQLTPV